MARKIGQITDADCYINGIDMCGRVAELNFGTLGHTMVRHSTLGMVGVLELPARPVKAIRGSISFDWIDEEVYRRLLNPTIVTPLQLHELVDIFGPEGLDAAASHTLVTSVGFQTMDSVFGASKLGTPKGVKHDITIGAFAQKVYGEEVPIVEFDGWNNIYKTNGQDVWPR